jgi:hypothetical protein
MSNAVEITINESLTEPTVPNSLAAGATKSVIPRAREGAKKTAFVPGMTWDR